MGDMIHIIIFIWGFGSGMDRSVIHCMRNIDTKIELLRAAGAARAKVFVLAIDDVEASVRTAAAVCKHFPHLTIIARARNRRHEYSLLDLGIEYIFRETLLSSLAISERVLCGLGISERHVQKVVNAFRKSDAQLVLEQHAVHDDEEKLIQTAIETAEELDSLLRSDTETGN